MSSRIQYTNSSASKTDTDIKYHSFNRKYNPSPQPDLVLLAADSQELAFASNSLHIDVLNWFW